MRTARFWAVLALWCACQAASSDLQTQQENDVLEKIDFMKPEAYFLNYKIDHRSDYIKMSNRTPMFIKRKLLKQRPHKEQTQATTQENPSSALVYERQDKMFAIKKADSDAKHNSDILSLNTSDGAENRATSMDPTTNIDDMEFNETTTMFPSEDFKIPPEGRHYYESGLDKENSYEAQKKNNAKPKELKPLTAREVFHHMIESCRRMEENLKHASEYTDEFFNMDNIYREYNAPPSDDFARNLAYDLRGLSRKDLETIREMRHAKLLDLLQLAVDRERAAEGRPTTSPTIFLYGYPPYRSAMSVIMPGTPPLCPTEGPGVKFDPYPGYPWKRDFFPTREAEPDNKI